MNNENSGDLEGLLEKAKRILDENQFSVLLTIALELSQFPKQSGLAPACYLPSSQYST